MFLKIRFVMPELFSRAMSVDPLFSPRDIERRCQQKDKPVWHCQHRPTVSPRLEELDSPWQQRPELQPDFLWCRGSATNSFGSVVM